MESDPRWPRQKLNSRRRQFQQQIELTVKEESNALLHLEHSFCGVASWTRQKVDQKYLESFEMWCWRIMEKISWTDRVRNEEVLQRVKESQGGEEYPTKNKNKGT